MIHTFMRFPLPPAKNTTLTEPLGTHPSSYAKQEIACGRGAVLPVSCPPDLPRSPQKPCKFADGYPIRASATDVLACLNRIATGV